MKFSWLRSWKARVGVALATLYLVYLLGAYFVAPPLLKRFLEEDLSAQLDRAVSVDKIVINPFVLSIELQGLAVGDDWEGNLASFERIFANAQLWASIFVAPTLREFEVAGAELTIKRNEDGALNFEKLLVPAPSAPDESAAPSHLPHFRIESIRLIDVATAVEDLVPATPFSERVALHQLEVQNVDTRPMEDGAPLALQGQFSDSAAFQMEAAIASLQPFEIDWRLALQGFDLASIQPYVSEFIEADVVGKLSVALGGAFELLDDGPRLELQSDTLMEVSNLSIFDRTNRRALARFDRLAIEGFQADSRGPEVALSVALTKPRLSVLMLREGTLALPRILVEGAEEDSAPGGGETAGLESTLRAALNELSLEGAVIDFRDESLATPAEISISSLDTKIENLVWGDPAMAPGTFGGALQLGEDAGAISYAGTLDLEPMQAAIEVSGDSVAIPLIQSYVGEHARVEIKDGSVALAARAEASLGEAGLQYALSGDVAVERFSVVGAEDDQPIINFASLALSGFQYDGEMGSLEEIVLTNPAFYLTIDEGGSNLGRIAYEVEEEKQEELLADSEVVEEAFALPAFEIGRLSILGGAAELRDNTVSPAFSSSVDQFELGMTKLSTNVETISEVKSSARVDKVGTLEVEGEIRLLAPTEQASIKMLIAGVDLTVGSPMTGKYLGRMLDKGLLNVESDVSISGGKLVNDNSVRIESLTLGEKVESEDALKLPLGLAIAILQDANGVITQPIPVRGDLTEPGVDKGTIILSALGAAVTNTIVKAVTSPFKVLAGLAGGPEDLDLLIFEGGEVSLNASNLSKIKAMAKVLELRPKLRLKVSSEINPKIEEDVLSRAVLARALENWEAGELPLALGGEIEPAQLILEYATKDLEPLMSAAMSKGLYASAIGEGLEVETPGKSQNASPADKVEVEASGPEAEARIPIVSAIRSFLGLKQKDRTGSEAALESKQNQVELAAVPPEGGVGDPESADASLDPETVRRRISEELGRIAINPDWLMALVQTREDLVIEALMEDYGITPNRILSAEGEPRALVEVESEGELSRIVFEASD